MDMTPLARSLLEPIPAHRTVGVEVLRAADGTAEIAADTPEGLTNVIGSLHSSGLVALVDAAGLGAIISAATRPEEFQGVLPLGAAASLEFLAPARGRLVATCRLTDEAQRVLRPLLDGQADRARFATSAEVTDAEGTLVCRGAFDWSVRRTAPPATRHHPE
ncbi:PaaI family thioesterase [Streptomyces sp. NPDC050982]|uniref:PaaI family thioesterase n=1 Tax=Streptomyces sp. NPDC050982 TaxID=3154746 RepID=UPI0033C96AA0